MISKRVLFVAVALLALSATSVMAQGGLVNVDDFIVNTLTINPGSHLDLAHSGIAKTTLYGDILGYVQSGTILSSAANADPDGLQTLAVMRGSDYKSAIGSTFEGKTVEDTDVLLLRRYYGDANCDGQVNYDDYGFVDAGFATDGSWCLGDMDHNNAVNYDDYGYVDAGFGKVGPAAAAGAAAVPEPSTFVLLIGLATIGFGAYLRKR